MRNYFSGKDLTTLHSDTSETDGTLTTLVMLLGEVHGELVHDFLGAALDFGVQGTLTVHDQETEGGLTFQDTSEGAGIEAGFARVDANIDRLERFEVNHKLFLGVAAFVNDVIAAKEHETVFGTARVKLDTFTSVGNGLLDGETVGFVLYIVGFAVFISEHSGYFF